MNKYVDYYKDNPKGFWFKRKLFGWGWTPVRWQGWVFLGIWLGLFAHAVWLIEKISPTNQEAVFHLLIQLVLLVLMLFLVGYGTGEKPKWMWGLPKKR